MTKETQSKSDAALAADLATAGVTAPTGKLSETEKAAQRQAIADRAATGDTSLDALPAPGASDAAATGGTPAAKRAAKTRVPAGSAPSVALRGHLTSNEDLYAACVLVKGDEASESQTTKVFGIIDKFAKKVGEKAVNLLRHRSAPDSVQVYTRYAINHLIAKGETTSKGLIAEYAAHNYKDGTCKAQANQMMMLLPGLGIASRSDKGLLTINDDSAILADYKAGPSTKK